MELNKKTAIIVGASTAIGFIGDVLTYSVAESQGKSFALHFPKGKALVQVLLLGIIGGFVLDLALQKIENSLKSKGELELENLVEQEKKKLAQGAVVGKVPTAVIWS